jgi:hypothetical protein
MLTHPTLVRAVPAVVLALVTLLTACATAPPGAAGWTPVPITSFGTVAGVWEGVLDRDQGRRDDWMEVQIREDGRYLVTSYRTIGVLKGEGTLQLKDGSLAFQGERGSGTLALLTRGAARRLELRHTSRQGATFSTYLTPKR